MIDDISIANRLDLPVEGVPEVNYPRGREAPKVRWLTEILSE